MNETRNETYKRLAALAASVGVDSDKVFELLVIVPQGEGSLNSGNGVTNDIKLMVKVSFTSLSRIGKKKFLSDT